MRVDFMAKSKLYGLLRVNTWEEKGVAPREAEDRGPFEAS